jgi:hypothetical protein
MIDVVGIYDENFTQLFETARAIKASVKEDSKLMEHPVETGATITDFSIVLPVEIELALIAPGVDAYRAVYGQIRRAFTSRTVLVVQTWTGLYQNMLIQSMPHEEEPALADAIAIALKLKEVQIVEAQYASLPARRVRNPANASTVNRGQQQPQQATSARSASVLFGIFN